MDGQKDREMDRWSNGQKDRLTMATFQDPPYDGGPISNISRALQKLF